MRQLAVLYIGALLMVVASYVGLVKVPERQFANASPRENLAGSYPQKEWGDIGKGRQQYVGLGCIYCHSQQVRPKGFGADLARGWGDRRTESADYLLDAPPLMGTMRTGPDLSTIGARQPSADWHYLHLFNPQLTSPGSNMPGFPFLFDVTSDPPASSVKTQLREDGARILWLVPKPEAIQLVTYLMNLNKTVPSWPQPNRRTNERRTRARLSRTSRHGTA